MRGSLSQAELETADPRHHHVVEVLGVVESHDFLTHHHARHIALQDDALDAGGEHRRGDLAVGHERDELWGRRGGLPKGIPPILQELVVVGAWAQALRRTAAADVDADIAREDDFCDEIGPHNQGAV